MSKPCRMRGRACCLKCRPNSSLRVEAGLELRSSNEFGASLVPMVSFGQVWSHQFGHQFGSSLIMIVNCEYPY